MYVTLENISATKIATNLYIIIHADPSLYKIEKRFVELELSFDTSIIRVLIMMQNFCKQLFEPIIYFQPDLPDDQKFALMKVCCVG